MSRKAGVPGERGGTSDAATAIIVPDRTQEVDFYGDPIPVAAVSGGDAYVALRPITDHLGLDPAGQRRRVQRDTVIGPRLHTLAITAADGRQRELLCIPLDLLPGYLFGIDTSRVRTDLVDKLTRYRAECFSVLWRTFNSEAATFVDRLPGDMVEGRSSSVGSAPETGVSGAAVALEIATAIQHLARQQLAMEERLTDVAGKQTVMADYLRGFIRDTDHRLRAIEYREHTATVDESQATEISLAVKAVGEVLRAQGNPLGYQSIYAMIYRDFSISTYHNLPAHAYDRVMSWLHDWYVQVTDAHGRALPADRSPQTPPQPRLLT